MIIFSAPGSTMLLGEHAVLAGYPAVVAAVNRRVTVSITKRDDKLITIDSPLGKFSGDLASLTETSISKPFEFILAAILFYQDKLTNGIDINITAEFSSTIGLGSSAAVTAAFVAALQKLVGVWQSDLASLHKIGLQIIHKVQGEASGADLAASIYAGTLLYQINKASQKIKHNPAITLVYCGYKTPTAEVIKKVQAQAKLAPQLYENIFAAVGNCAMQGAAAIANSDWPRLATLFMQQYKLQQKMQLSDEILDNLINTAEILPNILAAKISGSGLGDCIVTLGKLPCNYFPRNEKEKEQSVRQIDVVITDKGIKDESP